MLRSHFSLWFFRSPRNDLLSFVLFSLPNLRYEFPIRNETNNKYEHLNNFFLNIHPIQKHQNCNLQIRNVIGYLLKWCVSERNGGKTQLHSQSYSKYICTRKFFLRIFMTKYQRDWEKDNEKESKQKIYTLFIGRLSLFYAKKKTFINNIWLNFEIPNVCNSAL